VLLQLFREFRISDSAALHRAEQADGLITPTTQIVFEPGSVGRVSEKDNADPAQVHVAVVRVWRDAPHPHNGDDRTHVNTTNSQIPMVMSAGLIAAADWSRYPHSGRFFQDETFTTGWYLGELPDWVPECLQLLSRLGFQFPGDAVS